MADVVGINANGASQMQNAFDTYIKKIRNASTVTASSSLITNAFKGTTVEAQVRALTGSINNQIANLANELTGYKGVINTVKESYKKNDSSTTAIRNVTKSINEKS